MAKGQNTSLSGFFSIIRAYTHTDTYIQTHALHTDTHIQTHAYRHTHTHICRKTRTYTHAKNTLTYTLTHLQKDTHTHKIDRVSQRSELMCTM